MSLRSSGQQSQLRADKSLNKHFRDRQLPANENNNNSDWEKNAGLGNRSLSRI